MKINIPVLITFIVGIFLIRATLANPGLARPTFNEAPLSPDDLDKVAEAALSYTQSNMKVTGATLEVAHVQLITGAELPSLGLQELVSNHSLALVIVKGDIDISGAWPGSSQGTTRYQYVNYVFDLDIGRPTLIWAENEDTF